MAQDTDLRAAYLAMREETPELFENAASGGIDILSDEESVALAEEVASASVASGAPGHWRKSGVIYRDAYVTILKDAVRFPDGRLGTYTRVLLSRDAQRGVVVFPMRKGKCVLMREFRHSTRRFHWAIPRGLPENGSTAEANARREVYEEIGGTVTHIEHIGTVHPETGIAGYDSSLFFAEVSGDFKGQVGEAISDIIEVTPEELAAMIARDEITDGYILAAFSKLAASGKLRLQAGPRWFSGWRRRSK